MQIQTFIVYMLSAIYADDAYRQHTIGENIYTMAMKWENFSEYKCKISIAYMLSAMHTGDAYRQHTIGEKIYTSVVKHDSTRHKGQ